MNKIAVMLSADRVDAPMSSHFGKAPWVMIADREKANFEFVKNEALHGRSAAGIVMAAGCGDVILADIGDGALAHLQAAHIRAWAAAGAMSGEEALRNFAEGKMAPVPAARAGARHGEGHGGCCCSHRGGDSTTSCCRG